MRGMKEAKQTHEQTETRKTNLHAHVQRPIAAEAKTLYKKYGREGGLLLWLVGSMGSGEGETPPPNPPKKTRRMHITYPRCLVQLVRRHAQVQQHACCVVWEEGGIMSQ